MRNRYDYLLNFINIFSDTKIVKKKIRELSVKKRKKEKKIHAKKVNKHYFLTNIIINYLFILGLDGALLSPQEKKKKTVNAHVRGPDHSPTHASPGPTYTLPATHRRKKKEKEREKAKSKK